MDGVMEAVWVVAIGALLVSSGEYLVRDLWRYVRRGRR